MSELTNAMIAEAHGYGPITKLSVGVRFLESDEDCFTLVDHWREKKWGLLFDDQVFSDMPQADADFIHADIEGEAGCLSAYSCDADPGTRRREAICRAAMKLAAHVKADQGSLLPS